MAGEPVQVAPRRTDTGDSIGFYFPCKRMLVTNYMPYGAIFNIVSLRGGSYRHPSVFIQDARRVVRGSLQRSSIRGYVSSKMFRLAGATGWAIVRSLREDGAK